MAMGVMTPSASAGPVGAHEDVAVIGIDDQELIADQVHPALTTVALPLRGDGAGGRLLLNLWRKEEVPAETLRPGRSSAASA